MFGVATQRAAHAIERFVAGLGSTLGAACLGAQIVVTVGDVTARALFRTSSTPAQELEWHLFFAAALMASGAAYVRENHVRIDVLRERLSPIWRSRIEIAGCLGLVIPFCLVVGLLGAEFTYNSYLQSEGSRAGLGLPHRWIIKSTVPLGAGLLLLAALARLIREIPLARGTRAALSGGAA